MGALASMRGPRCGRPEQAADVICARNGTGSALRETTLSNCGTLSWGGEFSAGRARRSRCTATHSLDAD
jgi:hypothetical protein